MRDDTLYSIGPDRKSRTERLIDLSAERARRKPLAKPRVGWREWIGICAGCLGMLIMLTFALVVWFGFAK